MSIKESTPKTDNFHKRSCFGWDFYFSRFGNAWVSANWERWEYRQKSRKLSGLGL